MLSGLRPGDLVEVGSLRLAGSGGTSEWLDISVYIVYIYMYMYVDLSLALSLIFLVGLGFG